MSYVLLRTTTFIRAARRQIKKEPAMAPVLDAALARLSDDAHDLMLRTHRLKGALAGSWACSAGYDLRILFSFCTHEGSPAILLPTVGTHDEVY